MSTAPEPGASPNSNEPAVDQTIAAVSDTLALPGGTANATPQPGGAGAVGRASRGDDVLTTIPNYTIEAKLGEGGMGAVYRAKQNNLGRTVAIKVLSTRYGDNHMYVARLNREARVLARINHPNVIGCFDLGDHQGMKFVVMEYVEGKSLADMVDKRGPLPLNEALHFLKHAVYGLDHANALGIIHRDVKPENMLINRGQTPGTITRIYAGHTLKIADLGLATFTAEAPENTRLTAEGSTLGSPHFMSPEQTLGDNELDFRTDMYALGVTLYFMLTAQLPYAGPTVASIIAKKLSENMPDPRSSHPALPPVASLLIQIMTARNRNDRYRTYNELLQDVEAIEQGKPVAARPLPECRASLSLLPDSLAEIEKMVAHAAATAPILPMPVKGQTAVAIPPPPGYASSATARAVVTTTDSVITPQKKSALPMGLVIVAVCMFIGGSALIVTKLIGGDSKPPQIPIAERPKVPPTPEKLPDTSKPEQEQFHLRLVQNGSMEGWTYTGDPKDFGFDEEGKLFLTNLTGWSFAQRELPSSEYELRIWLKTAQGADACEVQIGIGPKGEYLAAGLRLPEGQSKVTVYVERRSALHLTLETLATVPNLSTDEIQDLTLKVWDKRATIKHRDKFLLSAELPADGVNSKKIRIAVNKGIGQFQSIEAHSRTAN